MTISHYFQSRFPFFTDRGVVLVLALQFIVVSLMSGPSVLQALFVAAALIVIWGAMLQVHQGALPHFLVTLFWANFLFGGTGMLIGHWIDMHFYMGHMMHDMHSISLSAALFNWMTAIMVLACVFTCPFLPQCLTRERGWRVHIFVHGLALFAMLAGMYFGHLLAVAMSLPPFVRFYLAVTMMGSMACAGFLIGLRLSERFHLAKVEP